MRDFLFELLFTAGRHVPVYIRSEPLPGERRQTVGRTQVQQKQLADTYDDTTVTERSTDVITASYNKHDDSHCSQNIFMMVDKQIEKYM